MDNAADMYKEHILDHYKHPHHFGTLKLCTHQHRGYNPLCGDDVTFMVQVKEGKVEDVRFCGRGCALCMACASMLTDEVIKRPVSEVMQMKKEKVEELLHITLSPVRLKCAFLPLETIQTALKGDDYAGSKESSC